ncbi:unnamed protein product [Allacma fusca]|uniref:Retrotransposon gag domain-containing protein n=1 Tax=Allacma fusca TaxID=39272 RepID=A0A8J2J958_9HEXA|nr:unnamed protein product [Allacma fusca]
MTSQPFDIPFSFDGDLLDPNTVEEFLLKFKLQMEKRNIKDTQWLDHIGKHLDEGLKSWYRLSNFATFDEFETKLKEFHRLRHNPHVADTKLTRRKKSPQESHSQYGFDVAAICEDVKITGTENIIKHLVQGLPPDLAARVSAVKQTAPKAVMEYLKLLSKNKSDIE